MVWGTPDLGWTNQTLPWDHCLCAEEAEQGEQERGLVAAIFPATCGLSAAGAQAPGAEMTAEESRRDLITKAPSSMLLPYPHISLSSLSLGTPLLLKLATSSSLWLVTKILPCRGSRYPPSTIAWGLGEMKLIRTKGGMMVQVRGPDQRCASGTAH